MHVILMYKTAAYPTPPFIVMFDKIRPEQSELIKPVILKCHKRQNNCCGKDYEYHTDIEMVSKITILQILTSIGCQI